MGCTLHAGLRLAAQHLAPRVRALTCCMRIGQHEAALYWLEPETTKFASPVAPGAARRGGSGGLQCSALPHASQARAHSMRLFGILALRLLGLWV